MALEDEGFGDAVVVVGPEGLGIVANVAEVRLAGFAFRRVLEASLDRHQTDTGQQTKHEE